MAEVIRMPKMSDTMTEGVIATWLKKPGDEVKPGDILAEVETDKATMELEAYEEGTLLHIGVKEGEAVPVDGIIAVIGKKGEDYQHLLEESNVAAAEKQAPEQEEAPVASQEMEPPAAVPDTSGIKATLITMPKMSDTMTEGTIAAWLKKPGDKVKAGDILAEVETDKATMELESYEDGTLLYIGPKEGESVPVDGVLAIIGEPGADYQALLDAHAAQTSSSAQAAPAPSTAPEQATAKKTDSKPPEQVTTQPSAPTPASGDRIKASPLARRMAKELGYDLSRIKGTGDGGRIVKRDIENYQPDTSTAATVLASATGALAGAPIGQEAYEEVPVSQMRKTIAKRLAESKFSAPHFYLTMEINMDKAIAARKSMNETAPVKISFNDLVVKAVAMALRQHPKVNSSWLGDKIRYNKHIHIGVAVAVEEGLLVPVVRFADQKTLATISAEIKELAGMAANKQLQPQHWEGNTFTVSNLGMFGIEEFTAIINPPDACILAVGGIKQTAVVQDGQLVPGNVMKVTLSCDHRVVDGATGAAFLKTLKELLEEPVRMLV
ncbi:MAG TPA: pyruvate dehydrogenase complex dihydrolipoamide acetyltransferase [Flammeovirgaceae bacterium]|nr:pyruvate dehydrogenase complex dihydrolipoamide acetyltransferase [Flammeovirgaceae bacterium]